eukprot:122222-Amphidinium_carterae.2
MDTSTLWKGKGKGPKGQGKDKGNQKGKQGQKSGGGTGSLRRPRALLVPRRTLFVTVAEGKVTRRQIVGDQVDPGGGAANKGKGKSIGGVDGESAEPASAGADDTGSLGGKVLADSGGWTGLNFDSGCGQTVMLHQTLQGRLCIMTEGGCFIASLTTAKRTELQGVTRRILHRDSRISEQKLPRLTPPSLWEWYVDDILAGGEK